MCCTVKETIPKAAEGLLSEWEEIFAHDISNKELVSQIYKEHI